MNQEINKIIREATDAIYMKMENETEQSLLASIIDIYENDYSYREYTNKLYNYNKEVRAHNFKLSIADEELVISQLMIEIPVLSYENFMFIRNMKKGNK